MQEVDDISLDHDDLTLESMNKPFGPFHLQLLDDLAIRGQSSILCFRSFAELLEVAEEVSCCRFVNLYHFEELVAEKSSPVDCP